MSSVRKASLLSMLLCLCPIADAARCVYISSYNTGYEWSDGIERGLRETLQDHCEITTFDMDSKRKQDPDQIAYAAQEAKKLIDSLQPDVVITSDDIASKHLIVPYYRDADIPFVFCGVNWSVVQYGFPYSNVTGMIEVAAIDPMFEMVRAITGRIRNATYIGADTLSEQKNSVRFAEAARKHNIELTIKLVKTRIEWLYAYGEAQSSDLILTGSNAGIENWDEQGIIEAIKPLTATLSVTNNSWMMPYTMFGMTKVPEEQGEWAGKIAIEILNGAKASEIPIIPNRRYNITVNNTLLNIAGIELPEYIRLKAQPVQ